MPFVRNTGFDSCLFFFFCGDNTTTANDETKRARCQKNFHAEPSGSQFCLEKPQLECVSCSVISSAWAWVPVLPCGIIILPCALRRPDLIRRQNRTALTEFQIRPISTRRQHKHIPSVNVCRHCCECVSMHVCVCVWVRASACVRSSAMLSEQQGTCLRCIHLAKQNTD